MKPNIQLRLRVVLLLPVMLLCAGMLFGQTLQVRGTVTDAVTGKPVEGAAVRVKNANSGTVTDAGGAFSITAAKNSRLVVNYVGYDAMETTVTGEQHSFRLNPSANRLEDVVITALGVKKEKKLVSYATQEIKGADLVKAREQNPVASLTGKIAGLTVGISPELLGRPQVLLRGSSIDLYVIDGIPINSDTWNVSPDDIENITVLKGSVASALYGYRGQRGAIIITTKKGSRDKRGFSIEFNSSTMLEKGFIALPRTQDEYGPGDHGKYAFVDGKGGGLNDGDYDVWGPKFEGQLIPQYDSPVDPVTGVRKGTPWTARGKDNLKRFIRPGLLATNNIAVSSSTDKYDIRMSMSHTYQRGIVPNTQLNITNFNINTGYRFSDNLKLDGQLNYNRQYTPNFPDVNYGPNSMIYNITVWGGADWDIDAMRNYWQPGKEGVQSIYAEYQRYHNPYFMVYEWLRGHYKTDIYGYASLTQKIGKHAELMARTAVTTYDLLRTEKMPFSAHPYGREENKGDYREDKRSLFENNTEVMAKYNNTFGFVGLNAFVGGNLRNFTYKSSFVTTDYLNVPNVYTFANSRNPIKAYSFNSEMRVLSGYYSVDLSLGKYANLNTTGRVDKISTLNKSYFYPSVSANTVISDYVTLPKAISFLKIRGSYANVKSAGSSVSSYIGATPNASYPLGYGSEYQSSYDGPTYSLVTPYNTALGYNNQPYATYPNNIIDPAIAPDSRSTIELGLDMKFLKNRLGLDVAFYSNTDGPQIYNKPLSQTTGYNSFITNAVKNRTNGLEISVSGQAIKTKDFSWDVLLNWSTYRRRLAELPEGVNVLNTFYRKGDRLDKVYVGSFVRTPDGALINDAGGRPIVNPIAQFKGYADPDWVWGLNNRFNYKNFSLSFQFDGRVGGIMEDYVRKQTFRGGRNIETVQGKMGDARYQDYKGIKSYIGDGVIVSNATPIQYDPATGAVTNFDKLQFTTNNIPTFLQDYISRYNGTSEGNLMSKTYFKLREVTIGYSLPVSVFGRKSFVRSASVSLVGRNLLYFIKDGNRYKDVDIDQYAGGQTSSGLQTPTMRRYGININLTF
ncbi:SusC/RagA family TonB-linked outer membrane protein [Sediminibacterium soli]|uniref:SusC/RagA family TonB-linked outer membrane protein n=1 Tax=Sediminibacterium soli TaxID=2698829 RepID=UPI001379EA53|nr:SusC/RagA family TonB-linked outer membrane protein [Sediminibacterium soli]NCI46283.1 SusC/RagA family TonB-linked outer membrane protein [Sediminibacterium soli]